MHKMSALLLGLFLALSSRAAAQAPTAPPAYRQVGTAKPGTIVFAAGAATFKDVVKTTTYVVNYKPAMRDELRAARLRAMGTVDPPAATLVGVQSLASEDWLVEIEVTAVIP